MYGAPLRPSCMAPLGSGHLGCHLSGHVPRLKIQRLSVVKHNCNLELHDTYSLWKHEIWTKVTKSCCYRNKRVQGLDNETCGTADEISSSNKALPRRIHRLAWNPGSATMYYNRLYPLLLGITSISRRQMRVMFGTDYTLITTLDTLSI